MNSTRLPGKVMMPLAGKPMVQNIVERVKRANRLDDVIVAIPVDDTRHFSSLPSDIFHLFCPCGGDENDLVERYLSVAIGNEADIIVRVPCDNPCVDPEYIDKAVGEYLREPYVFYTNTTDVCEGVYIDGIGAEVFSLSRLKWLDERTKRNVEHREHPHRLFYEYGEAEVPMADIRLDVNTQEDYDFINSIYSHFQHNHFTALDILNCPPVQERLHGR